MMNLRITLFTNVQEMQYSTYFDAFQTFFSDLILKHLRQHYDAPNLTLA